MCLPEHEKMCSLDYGNSDAACRGGLYQMDLRNGKAKHNKLHLRADLALAATCA